MERNEMRKKALGLPASTVTNDKENKMVESNVKKDPVATPTKAIASPRKSNQTSSKDLVRASSGKTPVKTISSKKEDADVAVEINITSSQSIQVEVEVAECEVDENGKMIKKGESTLNSLSNFDYSSSSISEHSRRNLKRLGVLYSDTDQISSPIQRTEENFCESKVTGGRPIKKFSKLAALADDINSWDDDYSHHSTHKETQSPMKCGSTGSPFKSSSTASPFKSTTSASPFKKAIGSPKTSTTSIIPKPPPFAFGSPGTKKDSLKKDSPKKLVWDKKVIDSLEAQGFSRRESAIPKLVYDYSNEKPSTSTGGNTSPAKKSLPKQTPISTTSSASSVVTKTVSSPAKKEIKPAVSSPKREIPKPSQIKHGNMRASNMFAKRDQKDPAEMSLKERMAIFEKNKGKPPVPATQFGITDANPIRTNMPELSKKFDFGFKKAAVEKEPNKEGTIENASGNNNIKDTVSQLLTKKVTTISEKQISEEIRKQREEDMKCIMSRYNKTSNDVSSENDGDEIMSEEKSERKRRSSSNEESTETQDVDEKRARISNNPPRLYPVLSDIETTDSEMDVYHTTATVSASEAEKVEETQSSDESDEENPRLERMSIGREILSTVCKNNDLSNHSYLESTISSTDVSDAIHDMDDYLNEALEENESKDYDDKGSACSDSFEYSRYPKRVSFKKVQNNDEFPVKSKLEISPAKSPQGSMTLVHTVSFYRRQQSASANNTPIKKVVHKSEEESEDDDYSSSGVPAQNNRKQREECDTKIQRLLDEVMRQQAVIKQTSQALNLCASTFEFSGSTEAVEGERHLLVATHRRIACLNEVQRLKCEGLIDRTGREKGTLSIQEIIIPLKQTYISRLASDEINGHHLLCLVKYNEYVLATKTLPTLPGLKCVKFTDNLTFNEVFADFKVNFNLFIYFAHKLI